MMRFVALLLLLVSPAWAVQDVYQFETEEQERRFRALGYQLNCPMCQNQSIGDSDADIAYDMRDRVHQMILEGKSDEEIVDFFVQRYGDFVNARPPVNARTVVIWLGPSLLLLFGAFGVAVLIVRASKRADEEEESP